MKHPAFDRLPKRLTITFPMWMIYATKGEYSPYYDIDKVMREHVERGFNCMRIDSGAGVMHDLSGNLREPFDMTDIFGEYERIPRQQHMLGDGGKCDLFGRLIKLFESAKKHGIYVILSQWYYLHTYWFQKRGDPVCDELFALPPEKRFDAFKMFWHYILLELEKRDLDSQIAYVEVFNEADDHPFLCGENGRWGSIRDIPDAEAEFYRKQHEKAIKWLRERHPNILFAYDNTTVDGAEKNMPESAQIYSFHSYYMWSLYNDALKGHDEWFKHEITPDDVKKSREGRRPTGEDWYQRVAQFNDLDYSYLNEIEMSLEETFIQNKEIYAAKRDRSLSLAVRLAGDKMPIVMGEGVSYICSKKILWEEKSEQYWQFIKEGLTRFKENNVWGTVIRTCCGPEDPSWEMCADKYLELNKFFLED